MEVIRTYQGKSLQDCVRRTRECHVAWWIIESSEFLLESDIHLAAIDYLLEGDRPSFPLIDINYRIVRLCSLKLNRRVVKCLLRRGFLRLLTHGRVCSPSIMPRAEHCSCPLEKYLAIWHAGKFNGWWWRTCISRRVRRARSQPFPLKFLRKWNWVIQADCLFVFYV